MNSWQWIKYRSTVLNEINLYTRRIGQDDVNDVDDADDDDDVLLRATSWVTLGYLV